MSSISTLYERKTDRGVALVFALIAVLIISVIVLGVTTTATQHYSLARTEVDQSAALDVAEAGVHFELNKMSMRENGYNVTIDNGANSPFTGVLTPSFDGANDEPNGGINSVFVASDIDRQSLWSAPGRFVVVSAGTIPREGAASGVTRTILAYGRAVSVGDLYTCYGVHSFTLNGVNAAFNQGSPGYIGSAGQASINVSGFTLINGTFVFDRLGGAQGSWSVSKPNLDYVNVPNETIMPTVDQIGSRVIQREFGILSDPLPYFKNNNDNGTRIMVRKPNGRLDPVSWQDKDGNPLPHDQINQKLFDANNPNPNGIGSYPLNLVLIGNPTVTSTGLPKGSDFYFQSIDLPKGCVLEIQNGVEDNILQGPVRVWLGPKGAAASDTNKFILQHGTIIVHWGDPAGQSDHGAFSIYNGTKAPLKIGTIPVTGQDDFVAQNAQKNVADNKGFFGVLYAYNADNGGGYGTIDIAGDLRLRGSAVAWDFVQSAGTLVAYPARSGTAGTADPYSYVLYYAVETPTNSTGWFEVNRLSAQPGGSQ